MKVYKANVRGKTKYVVDMGKASKNTRNRKFFNTKKEAEENLKKSIRELEKFNDEIAGNPNMFVRDRFFEFVEQNYDNIDTRKGFISKYNNYLDQFYRDMKLEDIKPVVMERFRIYVSKLKDINGNDISITLKESIWEKNKTFIFWLKNKKNIPPYEYFVGLKHFCDLHKRHAKKYMDLDSFKKFIHCVDDPVEKTYFVGLYTFGTRKSEQNNLKFKDVKNILEDISIEAQYKDKAHGETELKTEDSKRSIPMTRTYYNMVQILRSQRRKYGLSEEEIDEMHIYVNDRGEVIPRETIRRHYKKYLAKAGLSKDYRIHDLRGSYATRMIDETGNIELVKELLGHADVRTTMTYITASKKAKDKVRELNEIEGIEIEVENNGENEKDE